MITQKDIDRINELYRKSKAEGLTEDEALEQKALRKAYVTAFRDNLRGTLETIKIQNPDGSIDIVYELQKTDSEAPDLSIVRYKLKEKMKKEAEEAFEKGN